MISYMVFRCMETPVNLVNKEYYRDELAYQDLIDGAKKANGLSGKVTVRQEAATISLQLPPEMKNLELKGTVFFYCPSDMSRDRHLNLETDASARQEFNTRLFLPGHYTVKVRWEGRGVEYFAELPFVIL